MKNFKLASAIALVMSAAAIGNASAVDSGTITFTGSVSDATCTISGGAGTDGGTGNFTVALDQAALGDLANAGDIAKTKPFQVVIGLPGEASCAAGTVAHMRFVPSSPQVDADTGALRNAILPVAGGAGNTQVQVTDNAGAAINLADAANNTDVTIGDNNTATLNYRAQYLAVGGAATSGRVSTSVVYEVSYN
ncbi:MULTISPECIES: fimbrial protein [Gammaproteobacteria]|uniref:fimbrial protein n=1 Tax=Gammaproteobacteria TaxID=1236 RepID=UPI001125F30F|nr:fimbrial protein [Pseudomonas sp. Hp2]